MTGDTGRVARAEPERSVPHDGQLSGPRFRPVDVPPWQGSDGLWEFGTPMTSCSLCGMVLVDAEPYREVHVERCRP